MANVELSKAQVRKAGQTLRRFMRSGQTLSAEEAVKFEKAIVVVQQFRAAHQHPLVTANNGLRSMVRTAGCEVEVSQRLKRLNTILDKLVREPNLPLSSMQDIGGVRAVLNSIDEVRRVEARLKHNRPVLGYRDYISDPRRSGYRGVHVIVGYGGRQIEVQLRTRVMHDWAIAVERLSSRVGENLKGDGDHAVQAFLAAASEVMALEEHGRIVDSSTIAEMNRLRAIAEPYLRGGR